MLLEAVPGLLHFPIYLVVVIEHEDGIVKVTRERHEPVLDEKGQVNERREMVSLFEEPDLVFQILPGFGPGLPGEEGPGREELGRAGEFPEGREERPVHSPERPLRARVELPE